MPLQGKQLAAQRIGENRVGAARYRPRGLARDRRKTGGNTFLAIEPNLHQDQLLAVEAFPPDGCLETANLLEEFADKLLAVAGSCT
jgi:hypothetical protein